jgi:hypothetical protein
MHTCACGGSEWLGYCAGTDRFFDDIELMLGKRPGRTWIVSWKFVAPLALAVRKLLHHLPCFLWSTLSSTGSSIIAIHIFVFVHPPHHHFFLFRSRIIVIIPIYIIVAILLLLLLIMIIVVVIVIVDVMPMIVKLILLAVCRIMTW